MSETRIARYRLGIEKCRQQASCASNSEIETIWLSLADNYRWLLECEQRELDRDRWEYIIAEVTALKER